MIVGALTGLLRFFSQIDQHDIVALDFFEVSIGNELRFFGFEAAAFCRRGARGFPRDKSAFEHACGDAGFFGQRVGGFSRSLAAEAVVVNDDGTERRQLLLRRESGRHVKRAGNVTFFESRVRTHVNERDFLAGIDHALHFDRGNSCRGARERRAAQTADC